MPYRRIHLTLPANDQTDLEDICEGVNLIDVRTWKPSEDGRRSVEVLVRDDATEPMLEKLTEHFASEDCYHAEVIELAAVRPRPEEEDTEADESNGADGDEHNQRARNRISRDELLDDLMPGTKVTRVYLLMVLLSSVIAAIGLVRDNAAVVIGAMVIAPLLLPNMSLALGTTLGDGKMMLRSLGANLAGVGVCLAFAFAVGYFVDFDPAVKQIALRTETGYSDIALALAAGTAGALAVTSGVSANLIGVMVAVALLPPMVAFGLLMGGGLWDDAQNAGLLVAVNIICLNLAGVGTFLVRGVRPGRFYDTKDARRAVGGAIIVWVVALAAAAIVIWFAGQETKEAQRQGETPILEKQPPATEDPASNDDGADPDAPGPDEHHGPPTPKNPPDPDDALPE
jgi:uncharacterized hydrophobic protein (TIGR00341 family)